MLQRLQKKYLRIIVNGTSPMTHYIMILTCHRDAIRRLSQRYADGMEEHPTTFTSNLVRNAKTPRRLKKRLAQDLCN